MFSSWKLSASSENLVEMYILVSHPWDVLNLDLGRWVTSSPHFAWGIPGVSTNLAGCTPHCGTA